MNRIVFWFPIVALVVTPSFAAFEAGGQSRPTSKHRPLCRQGIYLLVARRAEDGSGVVTSILRLLPAAAIYKRIRLRRTTINLPSRAPP